MVQIVLHAGLAFPAEEHHFIYISETALKSKSTSIAESNPVIFYIASHQLTVFMSPYEARTTRKLRASPFGRTGPDNFS